MSVLAEFTCPVDAFPLSEGLSTLPDWHVELERIVPTSDSLLPFLLVWEPDPDTFESAIVDDPSVQSVTRLDEVENGALFRTEWHPDERSVLYGILVSGVTLLEATGKAGEWSIRVRADDRADMAEFRDYCTEHDVVLHLVRIAPFSAPAERRQHGLTEPQRAVLDLAYERGYFDDPRTVTLNDLGEELGVSRQAVASRMRRAHRNLVESVLRG